MKNPIKKVLVTGGAGYIGTFVVRSLQEQGFLPTIVDNLTTGNKQYVPCPLYKIDLLDKKALLALCKKEKFDAVIHLASLTIPSESMQKPSDYFSHNLLTTLNVLDVMVMTKIPYIIFSSSCSVYGTPKKLPVTEKTPRHPESVYATTKSHIEDVLASYDQIYGISSVSLRYFNACGAALDGSVGEQHAQETHLIPAAIQALLTKKTFTLYGDTYNTKDGTCMRDFVHVADVASAHVKALSYLQKTNKSDVFNVGSGKSNSVKTILSVIEDLSGQKVKIHRVPKRPGDPAAIGANIRKATRLLQWKPLHSDIKTIVGSALTWHLKQQQKQSKSAQKNLTEMTQV